MPKHTEYMNDHTRVNSTVSLEFYLRTIIPLLHRLILTLEQPTAFENIEGKGEIARCEQFLPFPQYFLLNQITVSPFVHISYIIYLFAAEFEEPKIGL